MHAFLVFVLAALLCVASPLSAQTPCASCLNTVEEGLRACLGNAFSSEDRVACEDKRQAQMQACVAGECKVERDEQAVRERRSEPQVPKRSGLTPYTPTSIEWLALTANAQLQEQASADRPYSLHVVEADPETLAIVVRHQPGASREQMARSIATARQVIMSTAKRHGWDAWVKIQERVEPVPAKP
ncbi:conserved exported protein of unknown function [Nitrospira japonica]|uniref:Secreted protein n=1 Tax=Nitrospira japonica TaxID=1325564 RepID=A0A1W1HZM6_9BACT|nr:hypothetical protein [Nitrospira japonica]SLM46206.1 conserved exported protein of unknown function [Nitrospira japonica]